MTYNQKFYQDFFNFLRNVSAKHNFKFKEHWDGGELWDTSLKRLNITVYADFYNCNVEILRHSSNAVKKIENAYKGCAYGRLIRLYNYNRFKDSCRYVWIKSFDSLNDYLNSFNGVEHSKVSRLQCISKLMALNVTSRVQGANMQGVILNAQQLLTVWNFEEYHWLEYLRMRDFIDGNSIYGNGFNFKG